MTKEELEKENAKLKQEKIPQLERKIASIRGAHSVDCKKLNARIEQVKRLQEENKELRVNIILLSKARKLLNEFMRISKASDEDFEHDFSELIAETENFLKESNK